MKTMAIHMHVYAKQYADFIPSYASVVVEMELFLTSVCCVMFQWGGVDCISQDLPMDNIAQGWEVSNMSLFQDSWVPFDA